MEVLKILWERFGNIPVDNEDKILEDFEATPYLMFPIGTPKEDVWHWFDKHCPNNLHDDLMFPNHNIGDSYTITLPKE